MGSQNPVVLDNSRDINPLLEKLVKDQSQTSFFYLGMFRICAGHLKARYDSTIDKMHANIKGEDSQCRQNFKSITFMMATFNFGGKVRCWKHCDQQNLLLGWCTITALGQFDPKCSTRFILWELKLVIDFPPGSTIIILSALMTYSNTQIVPGDECTLFTQYMPGAIFCWVDVGCLTKKALKATNTDAWAEHKKKAVPITNRLGIFSQVQEIFCRADI
ncbi:hypothetical protein Moror_13423, partial [Moniliophthora roreri MCA 2997]